MTEEGKACRHMVEQALEHYDMPTSESAIRLLCMIAAHESGGFTYSKQVRGPALSFFQMEPRTFFDLFKYCKRKFPKLSAEIPCSPKRMIFDPEFAAAMGRAFLFRIPEPLPEQEEIKALGRYAKTYWNTKYGKAKASDYSKAWQEYFGDSHENQR